METKTHQMLKPSTLKSILKKKNKYSKPSVFRKFMPKATQKSSRKQKVNFSGDERRWTYDNYWIIRKRIILGICFKHISKGYLQYRSVQVEISKKINDFNKLVKSHPPVKNHFEWKDKSFYDEFSRVEDEVRINYAKEQAVRKSIREHGELEYLVGTPTEEAILNRLKEELQEIKNDSGAAKMRIRKMMMEREKVDVMMMIRFVNGEITQEVFDQMHIRPKKKKTMSDWVRLPPKGELNKMEKELMQSILKAGSEGYGLVDLKKKYFHNPKVPNDSDILKDFNLDVDAFLKENEELQVETESLPAKQFPKLPISDRKYKEEFGDEFNKLVYGAEGGRRRRKRRTKRKVRKKGTKKKARRRRTRRRKRRRKRRTRKN
jgi:hypothetical protein